MLTIFKKDNIMLLKSVGGIFYIKKGGIVFKSIPLNEFLKLYSHNVKIYKKRALRINTHRDSHGNLNNSFFLDKYIRRTYFRLFNVRFFFSSLSDMETLTLFLFYKLVNLSIKNGKKSLNIRVWRKVFFNIKHKLKRDPFAVIMYSMVMASPRLCLKKKKIAGRTHYIPLFLPMWRQLRFGLKFLSLSIIHRTEYTFIDKLTNEFIDIVSKSNNSFCFKKKKELYALAVENKYYIKFL